MIPAALIDLDTMEIPDVFSIGGFMVGILASAIVPALHGEAVSGIAIVDSMRGLTAGLLGAFVGSAMVLWVALCAEVVLRKEAMGFGDVKLMGAIGAFCGWQGAVFAFFGGAVLGLLMLVVAWPWLRNSKGAEGATEDSVAGRIPFGPSLAAAALLYLLWFQPYVDGYFANIHELLQSF
jgi:leader peptidase (prepilin peptidase)/N-methyltransferase